MVSINSQLYEAQSRKRRFADCQTIDIAKAEFSKLQGNGDAQVDSAAQPDGAESTSARGEQGQAGQFGQAGQYGAVTGAGFGGGLAKGPGGQQQQQASGQPGEERKHRGSIYEGMAEDDSESYCSSLESVFRFQFSRFASYPSHEWTIPPSLLSSSFTTYTFQYLSPALTK